MVQEARDGQRGRSRRRPHIDGSRLYKNPRGEIGADFRWMNKGRVLLRDPKSEGWTPDGDTGDATKSERVARVWEAAYIAAWDNQVTRGHLGIVDAAAHPLARPLCEALDAFARMRAKQGLALGTLMGDETAFRRLRTWYGDNAPLASIRGEPAPGERAGYVTLGDRLRAMLAEGYELGTVRLTHQKITMFLRWCGSTAAEGIVLTSREARHNTARKRAWTDDEVAIVRAHAAEIDRAGRHPFSHALAVELGLATGMRRGELFAARWEGFLYPARRAVRVMEQMNLIEKRVTTTKSRKERVSLVLPFWWEHHRRGAAGLLLPDESGGYLKGERASHFISRILYRAGLKVEGEADGESTHMLRHTYARYFLQGGGTLYQLKNSLGHSSIAITESYYDHYAEEGLEDAERVFYPDLTKRRTA